MIYYVTPEQALFIHNRLIEETGGEHGVRDLSMLLSALGRPQASFNGEDLYAELFAKAAALLDSLIRNHPFIDGNKRSAITITALFLQNNGYSLQVDGAEMVRFIMACAQSATTLQEIKLWLERYCS